MKITKEYGWNEVVWEDLNIGDSIRLPVFTVPKVTIGGYSELSFDKQTVEDTATIYNIKNGKIYLIFDHALFHSAIDLNNAAEWKDTQLCAYLNGAFKDAMCRSGIPIWKVSLLSKDKRLKNPFFREGKNRIAFAKDEISTTCYWLRDTTDKREFYAVSVYGTIYAYNSSWSDFFVRPCFTLKMIKDEEPAVKEYHPYYSPAEIPGGAMLKEEDINLDKALMARLFNNEKEFSDEKN